MFEDEDIVRIEEPRAEPDQKDTLKQIYKKGEQRAKITDVIVR